MKIRSIGMLALTLVTSATAAGAQNETEDSWVDKAISPVANPIYFEPALIQSELRPVFMAHRLDKDFLGVDADVRLYAAQIRWAVTERLAIIAVKDGYIQVDPEGASTADGWADLAAGVKYAAVLDHEKELVVTPGITFSFPTGNGDVFQGNGKGGANLFASALKGWDNLHLSGNIGGYIPFDFDEETSSLHYSVMVDYYTCRWFIPFATLNAFTVLSEGKNAPLDSEGFDLINFGSMNASGRTQLSAGAGFRSRVLDSLDLGFAYEYGFSPDDDIFKDRITVDLLWRF